MDIKALIQSLIGVEVTTDDIQEIRNNPEACTTSKVDTAKLEELVLLLKLTEETEDI